MRSRRRIHASSPTNGTYERNGATFNGEPVYQQIGGIHKIYKRSGGNAVGNWVIDANGVDDTWDGTMNYTTDEPATPWEGTWNNMSLARCL